MKEFRLKIFSLNIFITAKLTNIELKDIVNLINHIFWQEYIPEVKIEIIDDNIDSTIIFNNKNEFNIKYDGIFPNIIDINLKDHGFIMDFIAICGKFLEFERQKKSLYTVHGAAISNKNIGIVFIGGMSGIGKTTTAIYFSSKNNYKFIADDKFILDENNGQIIAGSNFFKSQKILNSLKEKNLEKIEIEKIKYNIFIKYIIFPIITETEKLISYEIDSNKLIWHLYEEATRDIRNLNALTNNFTIPIQSFDNQEISQKRIDNIKKIVNNSKGYFLKGKVEDIYSFINKIIS